MVIRQVGRELGVRYVLEGSVRKANDRVRITGQLIDTASGAHIWADRFEGGLEAIFDLQDRVAASVAGAIEPALRSAEMRRAEAKPTAALDAYDCFLRALAASYRRDAEGYAEALALCRKAIEFDAAYATAYALAARCCMFRFFSPWAVDKEVERAQGVEFSRRAIALGTDDSVALHIAALPLQTLAGDAERAADVIDRSLALNGNCAQAWNTSGWIRMNLGDGDRAIEHIEMAMRLSPMDPLSFGFKCGMAYANFVAGRYQEAANWADRSLHDHPSFLTTMRIKLALCGLLGRNDEAQNLLRTVQSLEPGTTVTKWMSIIQMRRPDNRRAVTDGLRKAGLPE